LATLAAVPDQPQSLAEWLEPSLQDTAGRDPLGFNTITLDRILPQLLPGILQLSERARYFSIYPWLLWQFAERRREALGDVLDRFIRRREYELCLAFKLCPYCHGESAIGAQRAGPHITAHEDPLQRGLSIDTPKGGFGLYYRSPLVDLGAVVPVGVPLGEEAKPTPIETLRFEDERAVAVAKAFHEAIKDTAYYQNYERTDEPIPLRVMEALAERICLCRLPFHEAERDAVRRLLFQAANDEPDIVEACEARRRAFALFLSLVDEDPEVASDTGIFWRRLIERFDRDRLAQGSIADTLAPWAALAMKECLQDTICSVWTDFCRTGVRMQGLDGLTPVELQTLIDDLADAPELALGDLALALRGDESADAVQPRLVASTAQLDWNAIREWTVQSNDAGSGLAALLILADRVPEPGDVHRLWGEIARRGSEHQDGLLGIVALLRRRLSTEPTVAALLDWVVRRFVIAPHEVIAYSKLPKATFRFAWDESGRLRFFTPGGGGLDRFSSSDDRRQTMSTLSRDLGYWATDGPDGKACLTEDGKGFVAEVFA
jgi:hypothetical protein